MTIAAPTRPTLLYLASRSPRRLQLLRQFNLHVEPLLPADAEDSELLEQSRPGEAPANYVRRVVRAKLAKAQERATARGLPPAPILAADTTVAIGGTLFGKPASAAEAAATLQRLAGRTHRVLTAVAIAHGRRIDSAINVSRVTFARLRRHDIERYVATGEPMDKAGGYAVQGLAAIFIRRIDGSHSGIMGLPLHETALLLRRAGFELP